MEISRTISVEPVMEAYARLVEMSALYEYVPPTEQTLHTAERIVLVRSVPPVFPAGRGTGGTRSGHTRFFAYITACNELDCRRAATRVQGAGSVCWLLPRMSEEHISAVHCITGGGGSGGGGMSAHCTWTKWFAAC